MSAAVAVQAWFIYYKFKTMSLPVKIWRQAKTSCLYLGKKGRLVSCTLVNNPPKDYLAWAPYWTGIIELSGGKRVVNQLVTDGMKPEVGDRVIGVFRRLKPPDKAGVIEYGVKFKLVGADSVSARRIK